MHTKYLAPQLALQTGLSAAQPQCLSLLTSIALTAALAALAPRPAGAQCPMQSAPGFHVPGTDGEVKAIAEFDDGTGRAVYVAGRFSVAGEALANRIARFDGTRWNAVGGGVDDYYPGVNALAVFDDGTGPALYAAGGFASVGGGTPAANIARWDGHDWTPVGDGLEGEVLALAVFDEGRGLALYAGGSLSGAGGLPLSGIARWDGSTWSSLGEGIDGVVATLLTYDDGSEAALYVGGHFTFLGAGGGRNLARWNGAEWLGIGPAWDDGDATVSSLAIFDDGAGPSLYAGGSFQSIGGLSVNGIARWDGANWSALGEGLDYPAYRAEAQAMTVFDDGSGPALYVGGGFLAAGGIPARHIAKWDGNAWSPVLGGGIASMEYYPVDTLRVIDLYSGPRLWVGGYYDRLAEKFADNIAIWDGATVTELGGGLGLHGLGSAAALLVYDDGTGPQLYVGGDFQEAGDVSASAIARWNGSTWSPVGTGLEASVSTLAWWPGGPEAVLYAGGAFAQGIASWDGECWRGLGGGVRYGEYPGAAVLAMCPFDIGVGAALYVGGMFTIAGPVAASSLAKWNGSAWADVGDGVQYCGHQGTINALVGFDDGAGPALYVGGTFDSASGQPISYLAKWDGIAWHAVGEPLDGAVQSLGVFDDERGPALYVGGVFTHAGALTVNSIARWDGLAWTALENGFESVGGVLPVTVLGMASFDDGSGPMLYVVGRFTGPVGLYSPGIARWSGSKWSAVGHGLEGVGIDQIRPGEGDALAQWYDGDRAALYVCGGFGFVDGRLSCRIARLSCQPMYMPGDLNCDGIVNLFDVDPFVLAIADPSAYCAAFPECPIENADTNDDEAVNVFDIDPFVALLAGRR